MSDNKSFPWHAPLWERLVAEGAGDRLPHAILLHGPRGLGKIRFAARLTDLLLCEQPTERVPCGKCKGCKLRRAGNHPDQSVIAPLEDKITMSVDQIRALINGLSLSSHAGGFKTAVVAPAEAMTASAANSLLKTLEEPPGATVIVLCCNRLSALPVTIRSRCHAVRFSVPGRDIALQWLTGGAQDDGTWEDLLTVASGAPLRARELADTGFLALDAELAADLESLMAGATEPLALAARWEKTEIGNRLMWLEHWIQGLIRWRVVGENPVSRHSKLCKDLQEYGRYMVIPALFGYLDRVREARALLENPALNRRLLMESLLVPWADKLTPHRAGTRA